MVKIVFLLSAAMCLCQAAAVSRADSLAQVDEDGVMRWSDGGGEVALFGVNYYAPFTVDYAALTNLRIDVSQTMRNDVAHFRRLGIDCVRIHTFDRQFSTHDGRFVANRHIELLDELIEICASNGIYTVLTPIAWWGGVFAPEKTGFSAQWTMHEMTSIRESWRVQARFLKEFASHVNAFTGRRYADDPAVLCFELVNEPLYPSGHPDAAVTEYINTLADALRESGTKKPIFYNSWRGRNAAAGKARIDGVSGSWYPGGLAKGMSAISDPLPALDGSTLKPDASIARKARMIYEFDAPDAPGAAVYPAMAREFRHEGVQIAAQFQYDALPIAWNNRNWKTHYLNLVYTPAKALSFAIAAKAFRLWPRGCPQASGQYSRTFAPFKVDVSRNLSQMVTEKDYLYTSDPCDPPPAPERLEHIWGIGSSSVAAATGNGAYFLDKAAQGVWRLQLYPDVFVAGDLYSYDSSARAIVLPRPRRMTVLLNDLGKSFRVRSSGNDGSVIAVAREGAVTIAPGDYILENVATYGNADRIAVSKLDLPPYVVPPARSDPSGVDFATVPSCWRHGFPMTVGANVLGATNIIVTVQTVHGDCTKVFPVRLCRDVADWDFFDVQAAIKTPCKHIVHGVRKCLSRDGEGSMAFLFEADPGAFNRTDGKGFAAQPLYCDPGLFRSLFGDVGRGRTLLVKARATSPNTTKAEIVFTGEDGGNWGVNLPLTTQWRTMRVPVADFRPFWKTKHGDGTVPDMSRVKGISVAFGKWLYGSVVDCPHGFEISSVKVEF